MKTASLIPYPLLITLALISPFEITATEGQSPHLGKGGNYLSKIKSIDSRISHLTQYLDTYPPKIEYAYQKRDLVQEWQRIICELTDLSRQFPRNPEIELRLGECYRMGHNLDLPKAGINAAKHLEKAILLDPNNIEAHMILGRFYVNAGVNHAPKGEVEFLKALEIAGDKPLPNAHSGLFFAYYYQNRFQEALQQIDKYLQYYPEDKDMRDLREIARDKASGGEPPGIINLPLKTYEDDKPTSIVSPDKTEVRSANNNEVRDTSTPKRALLGHWRIAGEKTHIYFNDSDRCEIACEENGSGNISANYTVLTQSPSDRGVTIRIEYQSIENLFLGGLDEVTLSGRFSQDYEKFKGTYWHSRNKVVFWKVINNKPPDMIYVDSQTSP